MLRVLLVAAAILLQDPPTRPEDFPTVRPVLGELRAWRAAAKRAEAVREETPVHPDDRLGTARDQAATFAAPGDTLVTLRGVETGPDKGLSIERVDKRLTLKLREGRLVLESVEADIEVETAQGRAVAKKAYFLIEARESSTRVVVLDGQITFRNSLGAVTVGAGQETSASKDGAPQEPKAASPRDLVDPEAPRNLIQNPGFEARTLAPWTSGEGSVPSLDTTRRHSGDRSIRLDIAGSGPGRKYLSFRQSVEVVPGRRYLLRAYVLSECRAGRFQPVIDLEGATEEKGKRSSWDDDATGRWVMRRTILVAKERTLLVSLEAKAEADRFEGSVWGDDFFLCELPPLSGGR